MYERLLQTEIATYTVINDQGSITDYFANQLDTVLDDFLVSETKVEDYDTPYGKFKVRNTTDGNGDFHIVGNFKYAGKTSGLIFTIKGGATNLATKGSFV